MTQPILRLSKEKDTHTRFQTRAARGDVLRGLALLEKAARAQAA